MIQNAQDNIYNELVGSYTSHEGILVGLLKCNPIMVNFDHGRMIAWICKRIFVKTIAFTLAYGA